MYSISFTIVDFALISIFDCFKRKVTISILSEKHATCNGVNECFSIPSFMLPFLLEMKNWTRLRLPFQAKWKFLVFANLFTFWQPKSFLTTSIFPSLQAIWRGVIPLSSRLAPKFTSILSFDNNKVTTFVDPIWHARCNGVNPSLKKN